MALVSIIIPVYNAADYLGECLESALNQTWPDKEIIVVDDGSSDHSLDVARSYENKGVVVISQKNSGASAARNRGIEIAKGDWFQFLDADDYLRTDKIEAQLSLLKNQQQIAFCQTVHFQNSTFKELSVDNKYFYDRYANDPLRFLVGLYGGFDYKLRMIQPNAFLVPRCIIQKAGSWNEELSLDDDGEYFCRVILNANEIVYVAAPLNFYRKFLQSNSLSASKGLKAFRSQYQSILLKHNHLLTHNHDPELVPFIHTATYKSLQLLRHNLYPNYKNLLAEVTSFSASLIKHPSRKSEVYGGKFSNIIGNHISWKLLKRLQSFKSNNHK